MKFFLNSDECYMGENASSTSEGNTPQTAPLDNNIYLIEANCLSNVQEILYLFVLSSKLKLSSLEKRRKTTSMLVNKGNNGLI